MARIKQLLFLTLACCILSASARRGGRVIGGENAVTGQFPYQVSVLLNNKLHCGGSIIAANIILTAAHCVYNHNVEELTIVAGTNNLLEGNGVVMDVESYFYHDLYKEIKHDYDFDVALIYLSGFFVFGTNINSIQLPSSTFETTSGTAILTGFGMTGPNTGQTPILQWVPLNIEDYTICQKDKGFTARMICTSATGWPSSCPGDSGGPLVKDGLLVGIVSWGHECGYMGPTFYSHVPAYRDWIAIQTGL